jgi:hypothetical protein
VRPTEQRRLHFDLAGLEEIPYIFYVADKSKSLSRHTSETLSADRASNPLLRLLPDARLTHYVDAELPSDAIALMWVARAEDEGRAIHAPVHFGIHVPLECEEAERAAAARRPAGDRALHPKLKFYGVHDEQFAAVMGDDVDPSNPPNISTVATVHDRAVALIYQHTSVINLNTSINTTGPVGNYPSYIIRQCIVPALNPGDLIGAIKVAGDAWLVPTSPSTDGTPVVSWWPASGVAAALPGDLATAITNIQADTRLEGEQWHYGYSTTSSEYGATTDAPPPAAEATVARTMTGPQANWNVRILTSVNGLSIGNVTYTPPGTGTNWQAAGVWSKHDPMPLDNAVAQTLLAGAASVTITDSENTLTGTLIPGVPDPTTGLIPLTATFSNSGTGGASVTSCTVTLNSGLSGLTFSIVVAGLATGAKAEINVPVQSKQAVVYPLPFTDTTGAGQMTLTCTNTYLRHLSAFVQYLDNTSQPMAPPTQWVEQIPGFLQSTFEPHPMTKFVAMVPPVTTVFGIPAPADPVTITIPITEDVDTVRFLWGGLGCGTYDATVCPIGVAVTALAELALPVFLLVAGSAVTNSATVKSLLADKEVLFAVCTAGAFLAGGAAAADIATSQNSGAAATGLAEKFGPMLLSPATSLGLWVAKQFAVGTAERAVPFVDIALAVVNGAVTAANLAMTSIDVLDSPFVYETDVVGTMTIAVVLKPDPKIGKFPDDHDHFRVMVVYDSGTTVPVYEQHLPGTTLSDPITVNFKNCPVGGNVRAYAFFYAKNGWQSGHADPKDSVWKPAIITDAGGVTLDLTIDINPIPLNAFSVYEHQQKIGLVSESMDWIAAVNAPPLTIPTTASPYPGKSLVSTVCITAAQSPEMVGYAYQATGIGGSSQSQFTMQTMSLMQEPKKSYAIGGSFENAAAVCFDMASPNDGGRNFYVDPLGDFDPKVPGSGYHLRRVPLNRDHMPALGGETGKSWGRFPLPVTRCAVHPQGYVFAIGAYDKIFRVRLPKVAVPDASSPVATLMSGPGARTGLLKNPAGIAVALDARLLVLDAGNSRVQSFSIEGKPVPYFKNPGKGPKKLAVLPLRSAQGAQLLDLAVESKGYIYVLYSIDGGSSPSDFCVDLYEPDGTFLATTTGVTAGNIVVDILRNLWTLNYEIVLDATGRPQPSFSMWMPPPPAKREQLQ